MAPSSIKYTRKNPDPNSIELVDNPQKLLGEGKKNNIVFFRHAKIGSGFFRFLVYFFIVSKFKN